MSTSFDCKMSVNNQKDTADGLVESIQTTTMLILS